MRRIARTNEANGSGSRAGRQPEPVDRAARAAGSIGPIHAGNLCGQLPAWSRPVGYDAARRWWCEVVANEVVAKAASVLRDATVLCMARLISEPTSVEAAGSPPKTIREHVGRVNTTEERVSIAHMTSPAGWSEPWQRPEFDEWTVVLSGAVLVEDESGSFTVEAGQSAHAPAGARVRYSTPIGADYIAVCLPAFSPDTVRRDD